jgi:hypothetical protein
VDKVKHVNAKVGQWVRVKQAGTYNGDLGRVYDITDIKTGLYIKLVPRLSYGLDKQALAVKPPQKYFNPERAIGGEVRQVHHGVLQK